MQLSYKHLYAKKGVVDISDSCFKSIITNLQYADDTSIYIQPDKESEYACSKLIDSFSLVSACDKHRDNKGKRNCSLERQQDNISYPPCKKGIRPGICEKPAVSHEANFFYLFMYFFYFYLFNSNFFYFF